MPSELVVLQHHAQAGPGGFVDVLDARRALVPWRLVDLDAGDDLPALGGLAGLVSLGSPAGVLDDEPAPWMSEELALLREAVAADVPVLGVCLGAQLLATALGGKVTRRESPAIGFHPLWRSEAAAGDDVAAGWPDGTTALFFHRDEVAALPPDAGPLLTGTEAPAAWRAGSGLAVQFHPETTVEQLQGWLELPELRALLDAAGRDPGQLLEEARVRERFSLANGRALLGRFIDGPVRGRLAD